MCKVTIAIAVFNVEKYIGQTLQSVLNQDFNDLEILVCDDCSNDNSVKIVKDMAANHPNGYKVRIISNSVNSGTSAVRNNCIDNAKGEYLYFLDGDDYITPNCISLLYSRIIEEPIDVVMANHKAFCDSDEKVDVLINKNINYIDADLKGEMAVVKWMKLVKTEKFPGAMWNKLYRTSFLRDNNIKCKLNHGIIDDIYFTFRILLKAKSFASINEVTLFWRQRKGSAMNREFSEGQFRLYLKILDDMCDDLEVFRQKSPKKEIEKELLLYVGRRYLSGFIMQNLLLNTIVSREFKEEYFNHIHRVVDLGFVKGCSSSRYDNFVLKFLDNEKRYLILKYSFVVWSALKEVKRKILH